VAARLIFLRGGELVNVAGESHYQEALRALTDTDGATEVRLEVEAVLVPEPTNPHDPNAVMVQVGGLLVGYLPRQSAVAYGPMIAAVAARSRAAACEAMIAARGGPTSALGVFLRLPKPGDEAGTPPPRGAF
jgi:hypothetical protein